jgi:hypothetical protein
MKTSEKITKLAPDLVKAIGELKAVKKDSKNPFLKNKYASLDAIIEAAKPILFANNLCLFQAVTDGVETTLLHNSGEWISSDVMTIPAEQSKGLSAAQARGVAITYCKRYQLASMLGISTEEDTDGHIEKVEQKQELKQLQDEKYTKLIDYAKKETDLTKLLETVGKFKSAFTFTETQTNELAIIINEKQ